jgi:hypothetical protein
MRSIEELGKPGNAGWIAKVTVQPDLLEVQGTPAREGAPEHQFRDVEVAWYGDDRVKITLKGGGPAHIRQAYLSGAGQNVILDLVVPPGGEE